MTSLGSIYYQGKNIQSLSIPSGIMEQYKCALGYLFESFQCYLVLFIANILLEETSLYHIYINIKGIWSHSQSIPTYLFIGKIHARNKCSGPF